MSYETLLCEKSGAMARVTLNRPDKLNALTGLVVEELETCFRELADDPEVRVVILTGAGSKAFAAGADLQEISALTALTARDFACRGQRVFNQIENLGKPVIAAVNGF
jgi:enoyl-CoA hydratase